MDVRPRSIAIAVTLTPAVFLLLALLRRDRRTLLVSLASAAPLAQHHADILLLSERLDGLLAARDAARRALRIVHQNLIFSCLYNVLAIPLAAVGLVPPWLAGLGMAGSSLVVVLNALRAAR